MDIFEKCLNNQRAYFSAFKDKLEHYQSLPGLEGELGPHMMYGEKPVITWSYNDYLGLANHPSNRKLEKLVIDEAPVNYPMGSRFLSGNNSAYAELEQKFSEFVGAESALLFATGYLGAVGAIPALLSVNDSVILDADAHSCLFDAAKIAVANGAKMHIFRHNDMQHLEEQLQLAARHNGGILIVCDGVYSMQGDLAKLDEIVRLKEKYHARLFLDDAHGGGVMGNGRGTATHFNLADTVDIMMFTFSKAYGSTGGCVCGSKSIINYLRSNSRTYIFSHNMQLIFLRKVIGSLELLKSTPEILTRLWHNTKTLQAGLKDLGFDLGDTETPITPIIFKIKDLHADIDKLLKIVLTLRDDYGIYVSPIAYPAVPADRFLLRLTVTAGHTNDDVTATLNAFAKLKDNK